MSRITKIIDACNYHGIDVQISNPDGKGSHIQFHGKGIETTFCHGVKEAEIYLCGLEVGQRLTRDLYNL